MASGRRERKKRETRRHIVDEAVSLFTAQGYELTTMDDIAEAVDVSRATVFNFFPRKADLVLAWFAERRAEVGARLSEIDLVDAGTASRLATMYRAIAHVFDDDPRTGRAMVRAWLKAGGPMLTSDSETSQLFADAIHAGQLRGDVEKGIDADRVGRILFDAYLGSLYRWMSHDDAGTRLEADLLAALDVLTAGIVLARPTRSR
jgi:AcrR family transcriptional regulator